MPSIAPPASVPAVPAASISHNDAGADVPPGTVAPFDLGSWKQKLAHFGSNPEPRAPVSDSIAKDVVATDTPGKAPVAELVQIRLEWHRFIEHLTRKGLQVLVSHLHSCELISCSPKGVVEIGCCRKFSFEELFQDSTMLEQEIADFYRLPLKLQLRYDAQRDACTKEKTVFTMFQELSEKNEVVRFLIREFGGELVY
jgi:DNA polymerase III subunit gamma/tau